jgi:dTDP-4-amino-4,6-dideoxygalactose transaminase
MSSGLALVGGVPLITHPLAAYSTLSSEEIEAVADVLQSGALSSFVGQPGPEFYGGQKVKEFEEAFASMFGFNHAISVNSWTSGLWCIMGALDLEPGSEAITSSWTMAATATTILHWGVIPVFVDIDPQTFNLDIAAVEAAITPRTRVVVSPDIFGLSANNIELRALCDKHELLLVSDSAQSPLAMDSNGNRTSALADIGGFSLNYHKHIHTGEGGMVVTNRDDLAERVRMLRNHGEVVVQFGDDFQRHQRGILGMNLRMGEVEAAIGICQLRKLGDAIDSRINAANALSMGICNLDGLQTPILPSGYRHVYYVFGILLEDDLLSRISREIIVRALKAEGIPIFSGYQNIHTLALFSKQLAIGSFGWPYSELTKERRSELRETYLFFAEDFHKRRFLGLNMCAHEYTPKDIKLISQAFEKVWAHLPELQKLEMQSAD